MTEKIPSIPILKVFRNNWHLFVIIGLVIWLSVQSDKIAQLQLNKDAHIELIDGLNRELSTAKNQESNLRKELTELTTKYRQLHEEYQQLPTDKSVKDNRTYLTPDSYWLDIMRPIQTEIDSGEGRYLISPE